MPISMHVMFRTIMSSFRKQTVLTRTETDKRNPDCGLMKLLVLISMLPRRLSSQLTHNCKKRRINLKKGNKSTRTSINPHFIFPHFVPFLPLLRCVYAFPSIIPAIFPRFLSDFFPLFVNLFLRFASLPLSS